MVSQHWFCQWLGTIKQQSITWTNVDQYLQCHVVYQDHNELMMPDQRGCIGKSQIQKKLRKSHIFKMKPNKILLEHLPGGHVCTRLCCDLWINQTSCWNIKVIHHPPDEWCPLSHILDWLWVMTLVYMVSDMACLMDISVAQCKTAVTPLQ